MEGSIKPVRQLDHKSPVLVHEIIRIRIACVHNKQIRHRCKTPLETDVRIEVVDLVVILDKCGQEDLICYGDVELWAD